MGAAALVCRLMSKYVSSDNNGTNEQALCLYTTACEEDPELKSFDSSLDQRLSKLKRSLTTGGETGNNSLNAVKSVCGFLVEVNQNLAENIIANKDSLDEDILKSLVGLYHESSTSTLDLFNTARNCTYKAKLSISIIRIAIRQFEKESMDTNFGGNVKKAKYTETLEELNEVKATGDPFGDEFNDKLNSVKAEHLMLLEKLGELEKKLEKKQDRLKRKRKLTTIAFASVAASILAIEVCVCCIQPQLAVNSAVQGAAGLNQLVVTGGVLYANDKMKKGEKDLDRQKEVVNIIFNNTNVNIQGTNTIHSLVEKLIASLSLILGSVERAVVKREEEAVKTGMETIRDEVDTYATAIKEVGEAVATCSSCVASGNQQVLEIITNSMSSKGRSKLSKYKFWREDPTL